VIDRPVTITGPPGSGKSTAGRRVAERLGLEFRSAGELFRAEARKRGLDLGDFSRYAEAHEEVDRSLDEQMVVLAARGRLIEGRLTGALCRRRGVPCVYLHVTADAEVRYRRLAERDGIPFEAAVRATRDREASERDRYLRFYGIDLEAEVPDFSVDSTNETPETVAHRLLDYLGALRSRVEP
jgi:cytidylate kinase